MYFVYFLLFYMIVCHNSCYLQHSKLFSMFDCCLLKLTWKEEHVYEVLNTNVICKVSVIGFQHFAPKIYFVKVCLCLPCIKCTNIKMNCRVLKDIVIYNSLLCSLKTTNLNKNCTNVTYTSLNICI